MDKVTKLLTIAPSRYLETDKEWLEKLEEVQIDKLIACAEVGMTATSAIDTAEAGKAAVEAEKVIADARIASLEGEIAEMKKGTPQINEEAAMKVLQEKVSDMTTFASLLPDELKGQFEYGQKLYEGHRANLITHITTNQATKVWEEADLATQDTTTLQKIADSIKAPVSYEANGGIRTLNTEEEVLLPPHISAK